MVSQLFKNQTKFAKFKKWKTQYTVRHIPVSAINYVSTVQKRKKKKKLTDLPKFSPLRKFSKCYVRWIFLFFKIFFCRFFFYIITQWSCSASGSLREMTNSNPGPLPQKLPMSHHLSITISNITSSLFLSVHFL